MVSGNVEGDFQRSEWVFWLECLRQLVSIEGGGPRPGGIPNEDRGLIGTYP